LKNSANITEKENLLLFSNHFCIFKELQFFHHKISVNIAVFSFSFFFFPSIYYRDFPFNTGISDLESHPGMILGYMRECHSLEATENERMKPCGFFGLSVFIMKEWVRRMNMI
jgi:hypothetical protein